MKATHQIWRVVGCLLYLRDLIHDLRKPLDVLQEWSPSNFYRTDVIDDINDIGDSSFAQRGDSPPM